MWKITKEGMKEGDNITCRQETEIIIKAEYLGDWAKIQEIKQLHKAQDSQKLIKALNFKNSVSHQ